MLPLLIPLIFGIDDAILIPALIGLIGSLGGAGIAAASNKRNNQMMLDQKEEDKEYNSPVESATRLRAAGISPSLAGLDGAGVASSVPLNSNSEILQNAVKQLSDSAQGFSGQYLEKINLENQAAKDRADIEHQRNQDELAKMAFQNESLKLISDLRRADDEHMNDLIRNTDNMDKLALAFALSGRKPVGLDPENQKKFDEAYNAVDTNDPDFQLAKSELDKGKSANDVEKLIADERKKFLIENPYSEQLRVDYLVDRATKQANLHHMGLVNDAQELNNSFARDTYGNRVQESDISADESGMKYNARKKVISDLTFELEKIQYNLKRHDPMSAEYSRLKQQEEKIGSALDRLTTGVTIDRSRDFFGAPWLGELGSGQVSQIVGNLIP